MVGMLVCEEDCVNILELGMSIDRETPWIGQESFSFCFNKEATVSEFGNFHDANN